MVCVAAAGQRRAGSTSKLLDVGAAALSDMHFQNCWMVLLLRHLHTCCPRVAGDFVVLFRLFSIKLGTIFMFQVNLLQQKRKCKRDLRVHGDRNFPCV